MANQLDELRSQIEEAIKDAAEDVKTLEEFGPTIDRPERIKEAVVVNLKTAKNQSKVFKQAFRTLSLKKIAGPEGVPLPMLQPKDKEAYKKFNKLPEVKQLEQRLEAAMEKALSDRAALFGQQGADGAAEGSIEATDDAVERGEMKTAEIWTATDKTQDRTLDKVKQANQVATETFDIADEAERELQRQKQVVQDIRHEVQELNQRYGISFSIMGTILRQIACDGCFQALFGVLILAIIAFLVVKYI